MQGQGARQHKGRLHENCTHGARLAPTPRPIAAPAWERALMHAHLQGCPKLQQKPLHHHQISRGDDSAAAAGSRRKQHGSHAAGRGARCVCPGALQAQFKRACARHAGLLCAWISSSRKKETLLRHCRGILRALRALERHCPDSRHTCSEGARTM